LLCCPDEGVRLYEYEPPAEELIVCLPKLIESGVWYSGQTSGHIHLFLEN